MPPEGRSFRIRAQASSAEGTWEGRGGAFSPYPLCLLEVELGAELTNRGWRTEFGRSHVVVVVENAWLYVSTGLASSTFVMSTPTFGMVAAERGRAQQAP